MSLLPFRQPFRRGGDLLSVVSYNLLAPRWGTPERYPAPEGRGHLSWDVRGPRILEEIRGLRPDVLCLQEVEERVHVWLAAELECEGYKPVAKFKHGDLPSTDIFFWAGEGLRLGWAERRSKSTLASFSLPHGGTVGVACVHLEGHPRESQARCDQMRGVLRQLRRRAPLDSVIICGDFNATAGSAVHALLAFGSLPAEGWPDAGQLILPHEDDSRGARVELMDSYAEQQEVVSFCGRPGNGVRVDYLWASARLKVEGVLPTSEGLADTLSILEGLPNGEHPSDHLPIGALYRWHPEAPVALPDPVEGAKDEGGKTSAAELESLLPALLPPESVVMLSELDAAQEAAKGDIAALREVSARRAQLLESLDPEQRQIVRELAAARRREKKRKD
eukprot:Hpha_TRINITY_DN23932_c0_g1::TRINITY_DN23932_c0_g1_i1::g.137726::m.137726